MSTPTPARVDLDTGVLALGATWHLLWRAGDELGTRRIWRHVLRDLAALPAFVDAVEHLAPLTTAQLATHTQPGGPTS